MSGVNGGHTDKMTTELDSNALMLHVEALAPTSEASSHLRRTVS